MTERIRFRTGLYSKAAYRLFRHVAYLCASSDGFRFKVKVEDCERECNGEVSLRLSCPSGTDVRNAMSDMFADPDVVRLCGISPGDGSVLSGFFNGEPAPATWLGRERDEVQAGLWAGFKAESRKFVDEYYRKTLATRDTSVLSALYWEHVEAQERLRSKYGGCIDFDD